MAMRKIKDILEEQSDFGDNLGVDDVLGRELVVNSFTRFPTGWGDACKIMVSIEGHEESVLTWSTVLMDQIEAVQDELPAVGTINREKRYFTFT